MNNPAERRHEHGAFQLVQPAANILWSGCFGAWNEQTARRYVAECQQALVSMPGPIARVVDLREWEYGEPAIIAALSELYDWMDRVPVTRQVDLVNSKLTLKMHMQKLEHNNGITFSAAFSERETRQQLADSGFALPEMFRAPITRL